jgi:hypothetical protein
MLLLQVLGEESGERRTRLLLDVSRVYWGEVVQVGGRSGEKKWERRGERKRQSWGYREVVVWGGARSEGRE